MSILTRLFAFLGPTQEDRDYVRAAFEDARRGSHEIKAKGEEVARRMEDLAPADRDALTKLRQKRRELEHGKNRIEGLVRSMRNGGEDA